MKEKSWYP